ncbi:MAG: hypothetical protein A3H29_04655 [Acidobacteria bacterium RIFCSPLOWO2_02_FULL_67_21]|nr:MAG: hypothetical protein A3H29_04655 [Acidobacteria bacterium RIFCSPLOWO2_02_FULL_67_21]
MAESRKSGLRSDPGLASTERIAAIDPGRSLRTLRFTMVAAQRHSTTASGAPSAGQRYRVSASAARQRTGSDCSRSARIRISNSSCMAASDAARPCPAPDAAAPRRSAEPSARTSINRARQVSHHRRWASSTT